MEEKQKIVEEKQNLTDIVTCPICLDPYKNPTTLICGHSLCMEHIASLRKNIIQSPLEFEIKCPYCMQIHKYKEELSVNIVLRSLVETIFNSKSNINEVISSISEDSKSNNNNNVPPPQKIEPPKQRIIVDGIWGPQTMRALQEYLVQQGYKIYIDGNFGIQSIIALQQFLGNNGVLPFYTEFNNCVQGALQKYLKIHGQSDAPIDGMFLELSIRALQTFLKQKGHNISTDGRWGKQTTRILQTYLLSQGFSPGPIDSALGKQTIKALIQFLRSHSCCFLEIDGDWGSDTTATLQGWLQLRGQNPGPIDGMYGPETTAALQRVINISRK